MEKLTHKSKQIIAALKTLNQIITDFYELSPIARYYEELRDALIKRFEYSADLFWKFLREYLENQHGLTPPVTPKGVFKAALDAEIISTEEELALRLLIENRNLTSHTYNIELADEIAKFVPEHYVVMQKIVERLLGTNN